MLSLTIVIFHVHFVKEILTVLAALLRNIPKYATMMQFCPEMSTKLWYDSAYIQTEEYRYPITDYHRNFLKLTISSMLFKR